MEIKLNDEDLEKLAEKVADILEKRITEKVAGEQTYEGFVANIRKQVDTYINLNIKDIEIEERLEKALAKFSEAKAKLIIEAQIYKVLSEEAIRDLTFDRVLRYTSDAASTLKRRLLGGEDKET